MKNTKSISAGIRNLAVKSDETKLFKIKTLMNNFRKNSNNNIPYYPKDEQLNIEEYQFDDTLRHEYFKQVAEGSNVEGHNRFLREKQSLFYLNKLGQEKHLQIKSLEEQKYYNIANEINKRFKINKVEGNKNSTRTGILGYKVGMTGVWDKWGTWYPLTLIKIDRCQVISNKVCEKDKYFGLEVGCGEKKVSKTTRPLLGHFIKQGVPPKKDIREFKVSKENVLPIGFVLTVRHFVPGQFVDVQGVNKGKGWAGVMKRWNFKGGVASHGNSLCHRSAGSIGNREWPGKVWKGKKMSGRLGGVNDTKQNIRVYKIDYDRNLIYIVGSVPGNNKSLVFIKDAVKKHELQFNILPFPTFLEEKGKEYPSVMEWTTTVDRNEIFQHDNDEILGTSEEEEEGEAEKNPDEDVSAKK